MHVGLNIDAEDLVAAMLANPQALAMLRDALAPQAPAPGPYMTSAEAAAYLRCSRKRIHDLTSAGQLTAHHEGRRLLLLRAEVVALVE